MVELRLFSDLGQNTTKECVIHFWLSALVMTVKYISDLASSE